MINISAGSSCIVFYVMRTCSLSFPWGWFTLLILVALPTGCTAVATVKKQSNLTPKDQLLAFAAIEQGSDAPVHSSILHGKERHTTTGRLRFAKANHDPLASVLKLGFRGRLTNSSRNHKGNSDQTSFTYGVTLRSLARALKCGGLALGSTAGSTAGSTVAMEGIRYRRIATSPVLAVVLTLACVLSVAAVKRNEQGLPTTCRSWHPRPTGVRGTRRSSGTPVLGDAIVATVDTQEAASALSANGSLSWKGRVERWWGRRARTGVKMDRLKERLLLKAPRFPLAYASWWHALQDRRKRKVLMVVEGLEAEDHEVTKRAEGAQIFRSAQFWGRSATIYLSYKKMQARCALELPRIKNEEERELKREAYWAGIHELNSDRMLKLCLDLRGFYLKSGQFLGTRHDFMPKIFLKKLGKLHDDVPPMPGSKVAEVIQKELDAPPLEMFSNLNLSHPVGSASISQVHMGVLRETGEKVAVKVQYPGAEHVMMSDLRNLKSLAWFLQKFELNFDILSSLRELSKQIKGEFDFRAEAKTMDRMYLSLGNDFARINLPQSRLSTKRLLVMSYLEGESLAQLKRGEKERFKAARKRIGKDLLHELANAWGYMIFTEGLFNADPHPGNILIVREERVGNVKRVLGLLGLRTPKLRIGLLDWGQTKELRRIDRENVANLILAVSSRQSKDIVTCFKKLGVKLSNPNDADSIEKLALVMFDTRTIKGLDFNPFSTNNVLKLNAVKEYPQDLYFILRTVLMFRGMAQSLGVEFSLADFWAPYARRLIASLSPPPPPVPSRR